MHMKKYFKLFFGVDYLFFNAFVWANHFLKYFSLGYLKGFSNSKSYSKLILGMTFLKQFHIVPTAEERVSERSLGLGYC